MYDTGFLGAFEVGTFAVLVRIQRHLFRDVYKFFSPASLQNLTGSVSLIKEWFARITESREKSYHL